MSVPKLCLPKWKVTSRDVVVVAIFILFGCAYYSAYQRNDHDALTNFNGAILTAFASAWGYHLGSSKGAQENRDTLNAIATQPSVTAPQATTQTINVAAPEPD